MPDISAEDFYKNIFLKFRIFRIISFIGNIKKISLLQLRIWLLEIFSEPSAYISSSFLYQNAPLVLLLYIHQLPPIASLLANVCLKV